MAVFLGTNMIQKLETANVRQEDLVTNAKVSLNQSYELINEQLFDFKSILLDYECYNVGSLHGYEYDQTTKTCTCKPGWYSDICDKSKFELSANEISNLTF